MTATAPREAKLGWTELAPVRIAWSSIVLLQFGSRLVGAYNNSPGFCLTPADSMSSQSVTLLSLLPSLQGEIFSRVPFDCKRNSLPTVCEAFASLLADPPLPGLWGTITLDFFKLHTKFRCGFVREPSVFAAVQWLIDRCAGIERIGIRAQQDERSCKAVPEMMAVLGILLGGFASASHSPVFELDIPGDTDCPLFCPTLFLEPSLQAHFLQQLRRLEQLTELSLQAYALQGLDNLRHLSNLQSLSLAESKLSDVPEVIYALQQLTRLCLRRNCLTSLPSGLSRLEQLRELVLAHNDFNVFPDSQLALLTWLQRLDLSMQENDVDLVVSGPIACVQAMPYLKELHLIHSSTWDTVSMFHISRASNELRQAYRQGARLCAADIKYIDFFEVGDVSFANPSSDDSEEESEYSEDSEDDY
ncbi:hypothetical protein WJX72_010165 [[Myrmecia] bisecta]|uniref:Uncharacterized protein n=1 Tax=[Myrmecia] bisecta TaxID=41462 RepID=A0AAW1R9S0_9CHLO